MSSVERVPELPARRVSTRDLVAAAGPPRAADLCRGAVRRMRYGDGASHARALGFQLALAVLPLLIALIGLSAAMEVSSVRYVLQQTVLEVTPGASDPLIRRVLPSAGDGSALGGSALLMAFASAVVALTTAMAQIERGANRIYGIQRDRPFGAKYGRAVLLAVAAGLPVLGGSAVLVAGGAFAEAVESVNGLDDDVVGSLAWPAGVGLVVGAIAAMLRWCPARRPTGGLLLGIGTCIAFAAWVASTVLLAGFLHLSTGFGSVYGPLTGVIALLLWAQLGSAAVFLGLAVCAELELRIGRIRAHHDPTEPAARPRESTDAEDPTTVSGPPVPCP